jgi:hypothetical protein
VVILRCTGKLLNLLGRCAVTLVEAPPSEDDWYANLLWLDRRKCLLLLQAGTLFPLFVADIRIGDLRPIERRVVDLIQQALRDEELPVDALGDLDPDQVRIAKTASKQVLGVMNQMAFEIDWQINGRAASGTSTSTSSTAICGGACAPKTATTGYRSNSCSNGSSGSEPDAAK